MLFSSLLSNFAPFLFSGGLTSHLNTCNDLLSVPSHKQECVGIVGREGGNVNSFSNDFEIFQLDVNAPELPDGTSVWL